jgi:hypothetical protein
VRPTDANSARKWWQYAGNILREQFKPMMTWKDVEQVWTVSLPQPLMCSVGATRASTFLP